MNAKIQRLKEEVEQNSNKVVKVYSFEECPSCIKLKKGLDAIGVIYENVDMDGNLEMWEYLESMGGTDFVPQVTVEGKLIKEYDDVKELLSMVFTEIVDRKITIT